MRAISLLTALALAGCATRPEPASEGEYGAVSHDPFWMVTVGKDVIVLTRGPEGGRADGELMTHAYPLDTRTVEAGTRKWESNRGTGVITVTARPGACATGGRTYPDSVTVALSGVMLEGCGGEELKNGLPG